MSDAILAWRIWRLRTDPHTGAVEALLESCVYGDLWPPQQAFRAECSYREHDLPDLGCGCGLYAVATREAALLWARWAQTAMPHPIVLGRAHLWGRVLPHSAGYRAEHAYPYELEVLPGPDVDEAAALRLERKLRDRYLVDIVSRVA